MQGLYPLFNISVPNQRYFTAPTRLDSFDLLPKGYIVKQRERLICKNRRLRKVEWVIRYSDNQWYRIVAETIEAVKTESRKFIQMLVRETHPDIQNLYTQYVSNL